MAPRDITLIVFILLLILLIIFNAGGRSGSGLKKSNYIVQGGNAKSCLYGRAVDGRCNICMPGDYVINQYQPRCFNESSGKIYLPYLYPYARNPMEENDDIEAPNVLAKGGEID